MTEYIDIAIKYALMLFSKTEWHALTILLLITSSVTETAKRAVFVGYTKVKRNQYIYATAFCVGAISGLCGIYFGSPLISTWFWITAGMIAGPLSNMLHWLTLGLVAWKFPKLAEALKGK